MKNMKIEELKQQLQEKKQLSELIKITSYLSYTKKQIICETIIDNSITENENGMLVCNYFSKKLSKDIYLIINYSNIEIGDNLLEDYDYLCENKIVDYVLSKIDDNEKNFIYDMIELEIEQKVKIGNSIENLINKNLQRFIDVIEKNTDPKALNKLIKTASKEFKNFDPDKLKYINELKNVIDGKQVDKKAN